MNRDLEYILNYMVKYTKNRFMQDSEPMLNHKDIELVLKHIWELEDKIDKAIEHIKITIKIIKEQPSFCELNDIWTLEHLNSLLEILGDKE